MPSTSYNAIIKKIKSLLKRDTRFYRILKLAKSNFISHRFTSAASLPPQYTYSQISMSQSADKQEKKLIRFKNILNYTKTSGSWYSAINFEAGYHTLDLGFCKLAGQRSPAARLQDIPFNFDNKTVLDIGCNQGGMIFALKPRIRWGVGLDYDYRMINSCNLISKECAFINTSFFVFDIDKDPAELIRNFLPEDRVDIIFLLSVCMWVEKWREMIDFAVTISDAMLFESNGTEEQQQEQISYINSTFRDVRLIQPNSSDDDSISQKRQLFLALDPQKPITSLPASTISG